MSRSRFLLAALAVALLAASPVAEAQTCTRTDRFDLSPSAAQVLAAIEANSAALADSPVDPSRLLSTCNRFVSLEINGPDIFAAARDLIATADHEVDLGFFEWDHRVDAADLIGDGLIAAQARRTPSDPLLVRMMRDDVTADVSRVINELYDSTKDWISRGLDPNLVQFQLATVPRDTLAAPNYHDKLVVVDGRKVLITGANVQEQSNPGRWHDSGYVLEGDVALSVLDAFEDTWKHSETEHWDCRPRSYDTDCQQRSHYPQPSQPWKPAFGSQVKGNVPVLAVGAGKGTVFFNDTDKAQDIAWTTLMNRATSHIYVETPNINDDAFQAAIVAAVGRGVRVRLITSLGFNDFEEDLPTLGGSNLEVVGNLRKTIRASYPAYQDRFEVRWYGETGILPVTDKNDGASHTKYMSVDSQIAMVGSGNQDTISWNYAHELNILIDDPAVTQQIEAALFLADWNRSVNRYAELYEGNSGTQDIVCPVFTAALQTFSFSDQNFLEGELIDTWRCNNDETRSILLHDVAAGSVLRFYDSPDRLYQDDDWVEIVVKQPVSRKYISTYEQSFEDSEVQMYYHRDNGLDGKISAAEVRTSPIGAVVDLYEGNSATQSLVCSKRVSAYQSINFQSDSACDNDETRSLVLTNFPTDKVLIFYDDPGGSTGDDWTVIVPKRHLFRTVVSSYESSYENADVKVCHFHHNGLDGKVSRMRVGAPSEVAAVCPVGNVPPSRNRTYTLSPAPASQYPDTGDELTDGNTATGTDWISAAGWLNANPTLTVDLGQSHDLTTFDLYVGNSYGNGSYGVARPASVAVQTSNDGVNWSAAGSLSFVAEGAIGSKWQVDRGRLTLSRNARWVRFVVTRGGSWTMVTEMVVQGTPAPPPPAATTYTVSPAAASQYPDSGGELTDGNTATGTDWISAAGWLYVDPVVTLDLGQTRSLSEVQLYVANSYNNGSYGVARPAVVAVAVSTSGNSWTNVGNLSFGVYASSGSKWQVDRGLLVTGASARYVRFTVTRGGAWTLITEAKVLP